MAATDVRYTNAFCASPLRGPSRVSWITGTHPHTHGAVTHNNKRHRSGKVYHKTIEPGIHSLVNEIRDAGFTTHGSGFIHADQHVEGEPFPYPEDQIWDSLITDDFISFIEDTVRIPLIVSQPGSIPEGIESDALVSNIDLMPTMLRLSDPDIIDPRPTPPDWIANYGEDYCWLRNNGE